MKANFYYLAGLVGMILSSCATDVILDDKIETKNDSHFLKVEVTDKFAAAATRADYSGFPATTFEEDDAIGMYAFNGTTYVASNVRYVKQSDGSWLPDEDVPYCDGYTYYAYFPYRSTVYTPSTSGTVDAIDTKFADFIADGNNYFWQADQSTKAGFTYSNLMIAKGTVTDVGEDEATVKFTMVHKRGLAIVSAANKWYYTDATGTKYTATPVFNGANVPYDESGTLYYLVKPNVNTSAFGRTINLPAGEYKSCPIKLTGTPTYQYSVSTNQGSTWGSYSSTKPSWLTITPNIIDDEPTEFEVSMTDDKTTSISKGSFSNQPLFENPHNATLKAATPVSNVDLSMVDNAGTARASRTTANCYLVHAPGTYKIPLVYGNAIKDGDESSTSSFYTTQTSNTLQRLQNHTGAGITTPWITTQIGSCPDGARLIWQDVQGLISSVGIDTSDNGYLTFTIDEDNIAEGNAVIAATLSGTVVWSWHIWVTTETLSNTTVVETGSHNYTVAPVNVGQVNTVVGSGIKYAGSMSRVRATVDNVTVEFEVTQPDFLEMTTVTPYPSPYYQWGRKDAMMPATGAYNMSGTAIASYNSSDGTYATSATISTNIQNPDKWYNVSNKPYNSTARNCWDMNQTGGGNVATATIKTVYDPCPPEFCVPTGNLWYYFYNAVSGIMSTWDASYRTATWNIGITGDPIMFPASGFRADSGGTIVRVGEGGWSWSASAYSKDKGQDIYINSNNWLFGQDPRSVGFPVRPVAEE